MKCERAWSSCDHLPALDTERNRRGEERRGEERRGEERRGEEWSGEERIGERKRRKDAMTQATVNGRVPDTV